MITVPDVMRELDLDWTNEEAWHIGAAVRERWRQLHGSLPKKQLRKKTCGAGSHCFAIYPENFKPEIRRIVDMHTAAKAAQPDMFGF